MRAAHVGIRLGSSTTRRKRHERCQDDRADIDERRGLRGRDSRRDREGKRDGAQHRGGLGEGAEGSGSRWEGHRLPRPSRGDVRPGLTPRRGPRYGSPFQWRPRIGGPVGLPCWSRGAPRGLLAGVAVYVSQTPCDVVVWGSAIMATNRGVDLMGTPKPEIVGPEEWEVARAALLVKEKEVTRARDALAAWRRRMPMVAVEKTYRFEGTDGAATLLDLFDGRRQLVLYRFFMDPNMSSYPARGCKGCSLGADQLGNLAHLRARDTNYVAVSRGAQEHLQRYR